MTATVTGKRGDQYLVRHVSVPFAHIDYIKHTIAGSDVDPDTVELLS